MKKQHNLDAENAKLRSQCADLVDERERLFRANVEKNGEILRLVGENAKLRDLVKRMRRRINYKCGCCSIFCPDWDKENDCCVFTTLERELGIEVIE